MKNYLLGILFSLSTLSIWAQNVVEWSPEYTISLKDFGSSATQIGPQLISIHPTCKQEFTFQMSQYEFMFTKNFNSKVSTLFYPDASALIAPDTATALYLAEYVQVIFDLTELYSRRFREQLFLKKKGFSNASFFQPIFDDLQKEFIAKQAELSAQTELGKNTAQLAIARQQIKLEIEALNNFCKTCKPSKKK